MTFPGIAQAAMVVYCGVFSFKTYFENPSRVLANILLGFLFVGLGVLLISLDWFAPESLDEIWNFQAKDFYQGTVSFSFGVGLIAGNVVAWLFSLLKRVVN